MFQLSPVQGRATGGELRARRGQQDAGLIRGRSLAGLLRQGLSQHDLGAGRFQCRADRV
jgi:hypothetical protein